MDTETEAAYILSKVYRSENVVFVDDSGDGLADFIDLMASTESFPTRFVNVRTDELTAEEKLEWAVVAERVAEGTKPEIWVRSEGEWRFHEFVGRPEEWMPYLVVDVGDVDAVVESFREEIGFYS